MDVSQKLNLVDVLPWWQHELLYPMHQTMPQSELGGDPYVTYATLAEKLVGHTSPIAQDIFRALVVSQGGRDPGL